MIVVHSFKFLWPRRTGNAFELKTIKVEINIFCILQVWMGKCVCVCVWKSSKPVNLCLFLGYFSIYFFFIFFFWSNLFRRNEGIGIVVVTNTWNHSCCWCASAVSEFLLLRPSLGSTDSPVAHDGFFLMFVLVAKVCFSTQQRQQENLHGFQFLQGNTLKRQQTTTTEHRWRGYQ